MELSAPISHMQLYMRSKDYKDQFIDEYLQLKIRFNKLASMIRAWDAGLLNFLPTCPRVIYDDQLSSMSKYLDALERRATFENIDLGPFRLI